jgi:hypothetical protein
MHLMHVIAKRKVSLCLKICPNLVYLVIFYFLDNDIEEIGNPFMILHGVTGEHF